MSFQVTIMKVLAGQPDGKLPLAELRRDVAILSSSGREWSDRTKRMAERAPGLDMFSQGLVLRDAAGWQITAAGRALLASIEAPASAREDTLESAEPAALPMPVRLIGINSRRRRRRLRSLKVAARSRAA